MKVLMLGQDNRRNIGQRIAIGCHLLAQATTDEPRFYANLIIGCDYVTSCWNPTMFWTPNDGMFGWKYINRK